MYQYIKNTASGGTWEISGTTGKKRTVETNYLYLLKIALLFILLFSAASNAQQIKQTGTTVSYGYTNKPIAAGSKMKATISVGQNFTKMKIANGSYSSAVGIWSFYLQPPLAPHVLPTQGDYPDRVDVNWSIDPLSAPADVDYFKVYKDNTLIATVSAALHTYKDLDVHPGNYYEYKVTGVNEFGESQAGIGVGFVNPSGTFTGRVTTKFQAPVNDVEITMTPNPGKAFVFNGLNNYADAGSNLDLENTSFTIEFWLRREVAEEGTVFSQNLRDSSGLTPRDSQLVIGFTNGGNSFYASFNAASSAVFSDSVDGQWHHYAWVYNMESDSAIIYKDGISQIQYLAGGSYQGAGKMLFSYNYAIYFPMSIDEMRFWSTAKDSESISRNMKRSVSSVSSGLLCYWKFDEGKGTRFFDYATKKNTGNIAGTVQFSDDRPPIRVTAFTDSTGFYIADGINYGTSTNFTVQPERPGRAFNPATKLVTLSTSNTAVNNVDFTDISQIPVSGYITHEGTACPVDTTVEILVDGESWSPKIFVDKTGKYLVEFPPGSTHTLAPSHKGYLFSPASYTIDSLIVPVSNKNFVQFNKYAFKVIVAGGKCEFPLGGLNTVTITSIPSCYTATLSDTMKEFTFTDLPPVLFKIEVTRQDLITFESQTIDLRDTNVLNDNNRKVKFIYRSPLLVKIDTSFLPTQGDCGTPKIVLSQLHKYVLKYTAGEQYNAGFCVVDSIDFAVYNFIGDEGSPRSISGLEGIVTDTIIAGYPNTLDGGPHPFQKQLLVKAVTPDNRLAQNDFWALVAGIKPRQGQTFVSRGPDMPLLILRAPPGDFSWSYWGQNSTAYSQLSVSVDTSSSNYGGVYLSLAPKFTASAGFGFLVGAEIKPIVEGTYNFTTAAGNSTLSSLNIAITATENITTPMDPIHTGHNSDVYIGAAFNFVFGLADSIYFQADSCIIKKKPVIISAPDSVATKYIYTEDHITQTLIPNLQNHMNAFPYGSYHHVNDSLAIDNWTRLVAYNDSLKTNATDSLRNISFSAGPFYNYEEQFTRDNSQNFTVYSTVDEDLGGTLGILFNEAGISRTKVWAFHGGFQTDSLVGNSLTTTIGYTLGDDDAGDFFSVNVAKDKVFNTPVFKTIAGASSCPYEPGTMTRNLAVLTPKYLSAINVNPDSFAVFPVYLGNASGTDETGDYFLRVLNATNPDGAIISVNGIIIENGITYTLAPGQTQTYLTIRRGPFAYHYDGIKVMLGPACGDDQVSDTLTIGVDFLKPCSEIVVTQPLSNWLVNTSNNNIMNVSIAGFDSSATSGVQNIKLQYRAGLSGNDRPAGDTSGTGISKKYDLTSLKHIPFMSDKNRKLLKSLTDSYDAALDSRTNALAVYAKSTDGKYHDFRGMIPPWEKVNKPRVVPSLQKPFHASMLKADPESAAALPAKAQSTGLMIEGTENSWTTFKTYSPADIAGHGVLSYAWNVGDLDDGGYEIRAVSQCDGSSIDGASAIASGLIDRMGPMVQGLPQPQNGILTASDQIAIAFTKTISVASLTALGNFELRYSSGPQQGQPIDFNFTTDGRTIVITPAVDDRFMENNSIVAVVKHVKDTHGNPMRVLYGTTYKDSIAWEFVVQKSPVRWSGGDITITKELGETVAITRQLVNNSGFPNPYHLQNIPGWMGVSSTNGIVPNLGNVPIEFTFGPNLGYGSYDVTVTDSTIYGDQPLRIHINVLCHSPNWVVNESMFQYSMNIVGKLFIDTAAIINPNDLVGAFVGQELRGAARLKKLNENTFRIFLTVYSNIENGEQLQLRVWDSSSCNEFGQVIEQFTFASNSVLGTVNNPVTITATNQTIQQYSMKSGWTWLSFNTKSADMSVSNVLSGLSPSPNDIIKDQTSFAQYVNNDVWFGSLDTIRNTKMYMLKLVNKDSLNHIGYPVQPGISPIAINPGWNYIAYLPQVNLDVNAALGSLDALNGDLIKSQFSFAMYDSAFGWVGDLIQMKPKLGYFIKLGHLDTLIYPSGSGPAASILLAEDASQKFIPGQPEWLLSISNYQFSMNAVAVLANGILDTIGTETILGLFSNNECRGFIPAVYSELAKSYVFYLTAYSNKSTNDSLSIRIYNGYTKTVIPVRGTLVFESDRVYGTLKDPFVITGSPLGASGTQLLPVEFSLSQNYPNPFNPSTTIGFAVPVETDVEIIIYNIMGEKVKQIVGEHKQTGFYSVVWDGRNDYSDVVSSGIYIYSMKAGNYQSTKKLTFLK